MCSRLFLECFFSFFRDSTALSASKAWILGTVRMLMLKSAVLSLKNQKSAVLSLKNQKILARRRFVCPRLFLECFFRFFRDSTALSASKAWIFGTEQHFLHDAHVPKKPKKCCTVPKTKNSLPEGGLCAQDCFWNGFLGFFRDSTAFSASKAWILGTVQHF